MTFKLCYNRVPLTTYGFNFWKVTQISFREIVVYEQNTEISNIDIVLYKLRIIFLETKRTPIEIT